MNTSKSDIFKDTVILIDSRTLKENDDILEKVSVYIEERGGCVFMSLLTHTDSDSIEILPSPKKGVRCTHVIAEDGTFDAVWWKSFSDCGLDMAGAEVANLAWVFACLHARTLLPCKASLYSPDRMKAHPVDMSKEKNHSIYTDDTMDVGISVSCSGFKKIARTLVESMTSSMGMTFHKDMRLSGIAKTDALIVLDSSDRFSAKLKAAKQAKIPVVSFAWLLDSYKEWKLLPFDNPNYQNASEKDLDGLVVVVPDETIPEDELVPDSETSESARDCSPTPPLSHLSIPSGNLVCLVSQEGDDVVDDQPNSTGNGDAQPISQDLSSSSSSGNQDGGDSMPCTNTMHPSPEVEQEQTKGDSLPSKRKSETPQDAPSPPKMKSPIKKQRVISRVHITMSGMHSREQQECLSLVRALGVTYTAGTHSWNQRFTHVITPSLRRNQKCLSALACGAWILHPSFLKASLSTNSLVPEESYEIRSGNKASGVDSNMPCFWRTTIARTGKRAFEGLVCSLYKITSSSTPSKEDIRAIITAGGGTIIPHYKADDSSCDLIITSNPDAVSLGKKTMERKVIASRDIVMWLVSTSTTLSFKTRDPKISSLLAMRQGR